MDDDMGGSPTYGRGRGVRSRGSFSSRGFRGSRGGRGGRFDSSRSRGGSFRSRGGSFRGRGGSSRSYDDYIPRSSSSLISRGRGSALLKGITDLLSSRARLPLSDFGMERGRGRGGRFSSRGRYNDRPSRYSPAPRDMYSRHKSPPGNYSNGFSSREFTHRSKPMDYEYSSRKFDDYREPKYKEDLYRGPPRHRDDYRYSSPPPRRMVLRSASPPPRRRFSPPPRRSPPTMRLSPVRHRYRSRSPIMRGRSIDREERMRPTRGGHRGWSPGSPRRRSPEFSGRPFRPPLRKESYDKEPFYKSRGSSRGYGKPRGFPPKGEFRSKESYGGSRY